MKVIREHNISDVKTLKLAIEQSRFKRDHHLDRTIKKYEIFVDIWTPHRLITSGLQDLLPKVIGQSAAQLASLIGNSKGGDTLFSRAQTLLANLAKIWIPILVKKAA